MKVNDILKKSSEHFNLDGLTIGNLEPIRRCFFENGYTEQKVFQRLGARDIENFYVKLLPVYLWIKLKENNPLDRLIKLFLLARNLPRPQVEEIFEDNLPLMLKIGLLVQGNEGIYSPVNVYPCRDGLFATDNFLTPVYLSRHVYPLGCDSYCLARAMIKDPVEKSLDLCTGSGVQAILASRFSKKVIGVDINPRAVNFARFNALLNGRDNVEFRRGNLYEAVKGEKFDRIFSNPPYVPTPERRLYFRDGSVTGESILKKIVAELPHCLEEGGISQIVSLLIFTGDDYNEKVRSWLSMEQFHMLILAGRFTDIETYILNYINPDVSFLDFASKLVQWVEAYQVSGIRKVSDGLINIMRSSGKEPVIEMREFRIPTRDFSGEINTWLRNADKPAEYFEEVLNNDLYISSWIDFFWEGTDQNNNKNDGALCKKDALFIDEKLSPQEKKILDLVASGICKGTEIKKKLLENFKNENIIELFSRLLRIGIIKINKKI